jgi:integrase
MAKKHHAKTLSLAGVKPFEPCCLRHTALTRLAKAGCHAFTLARIAGHSSLTITQRYCHSQDYAVERAFAQMVTRQEVVTDGGHSPKQLAGSTVEMQSANTVATCG